jgi:hypothetical protein
MRAFFVSGDLRGKSPETKNRAFRGCAIAPAPALRAGAASHPSNPLRPTGLPGQASSGVLFPLPFGFYKILNRFSGHGIFASIRPEAFISHNAFQRFLPCCLYAINNSKFQTFCPNRILKKIYPGILFCNSFPVIESVFQNPVSPLAAQRIAAEIQYLRRFVP